MLAMMCERVSCWIFALLIACSRDSRSVLLKALRKMRLRSVSLALFTVILCSCCGRTHKRLAKTTMIHHHLCANRTTKTIKIVTLKEKQ